MPGLFSRLKIWKGLETILNKDLNAEFDNIINNLGVDEISGWSLNIAEMQKQTSPGTFGAESLSVSIADEIERIRFQLNAIIGGPDNVWYDAPLLSISQINTLLAGGVPKNRIVGGLVRASSLFPIHITPGGVTNQITINATATPLKVFINGIEVDFKTDIVFPALGTAPTSQNTFLINDTNADLSEATKNFGDYIALYQDLADGTNRLFQDYTLVGSACGTNIANLAGTYQAFSYTHAGSTEYFFGYIDPATTGGGAAYIRKCFRGCFFDQNNLPIPSIPMNNGEAVTLLRLAWIFINNQGTVLITYNNPRFSPTQPVTSFSGDFWYDTVNQKWKVSNGATFSDANAELLGMACTDTTNVVGARAFEWYRPYSNTSNVVPEFLSTTEYRTKYDTNTASLYGAPVIFDKDTVRWSAATDVDTGVTLTNSNSYFLYLTETGASKISDKAPLRRFDLGGYYHPHQSWRCFGVFFFDGSGNFDANKLAVISNLNGEFLNDKSISVAKKKSMPALQVADFDGFAESPFISFSTSSGSYVTITGLTCTLKTTGRPVFIGLINNDPSVTGDIDITSSSGIAAFGMQIYNGANVISTIDEQNNSGSGATNAVLIVPPSAIWTIDKPDAGTQVYTFQVKVQGAGTQTFSVNHIKVIAFEI